ncbi:hypothetical protein [Nostoc sp.]|uniref:hypothetical protein n=1 Tax=Nostoc sp. TaxID=1180 RepID=UPI002FF8DFB9
MIPTVIAPHTPVAHWGNPLLYKTLRERAASCREGPSLSLWEKTALAAPLNPLPARGGETKRSFGGVG